MANRPILTHIIIERLVAQQQCGGWFAAFLLPYFVPTVVSDSNLWEAPPRCL